MIIKHIAAALLVLLLAGGVLTALSVIAIFGAKVIAAIRDILHGGDTKNE